MSILNRLFGNRKITESKKVNIQSGKLSEESLSKKLDGIKLQTGSGSGMETAIEVLHNDQSWQKRRDAAKVLANYVDNRAFDALINALKHDNEWVVRFISADSLGGFGEMALEPLIAALNDKQKSVVEYAAKSLGKIRDKRGIDPLIKTLTYKDDYAPVEAARDALVKIGSDAVPMLLSHINDAEIHGEVVRALADIGDMRAAEVLFLVAKDFTEKTYIRIHAVRGLGQLSDFDSSPTLIELLSETSDNKLVDALIESLKQLRPGININEAALNAKKRGLEKYLTDLKSIVPGMSEKVARSLSGAHSCFQAGANLVCNTKFGDFQLIVGSDKRVISTMFLENVIKKVETELRNIE